MTKRINKLYLSAICLFAVFFQSCEKEEIINIIGESEQAVELKIAMRYLWADHATYTRDVILGILDQTADANDALNRLLQNQVDIGDAIKPYYGDEGGNQLTDLLTEHI